MNYLLILLLSFIVGTSYYCMMESTIPKESNCSFVASIWTDLFAFLAGFILIYKGIEHDDNIITNNNRENITTKNNNNTIHNNNKITNNKNNMNQTTKNNKNTKNNNNNSNNNTNNNKTPK